MMCNDAWGAVMGLVSLVLLAAGIVWLYFSIKFFGKASEYFQAELNERQFRREQINEMLAKLDQMVDVLKIK